MEDSLGVPPPQELAQLGPGEEGLEEEEVCRLADEIKEHDPSPDPVLEEPHHQEGPLDREGPLDKEGDRISQTPQSSGHDNLGAVSGFLSGFAAAVQTTSQGLVSGGLDALETIGKKTMEVLSEGDPGLAKKRALLGVGEAPTLSQLLTEAKAEVVVGEVDSAPCPLSYSRLFDDYHGVGHLEALELLSKECAGKLHSACGGLSDSDLQSFQDKLTPLSESFTIEEDQANLDDDSSQLEEVKELFSSITLPLKVDKLSKVSSSWREKVLAVSGRGEEEEADRKSVV